MTIRPTLPFKATLHVRDACLCLHTQRAARALARRFDEALRPTGLTNEQFSLLMALNRPRAASMSELASLLGADRTTLTAAVKPLVRRGLAEVGVDAADSRVRRIWLTAEGHARLTAAMPLWTGAHAALEAELGDADPARLRRDLKVLSGSGGRASAP
ncbi:MAG TPA: MarR family winged helix-turn-helix transcriptional regulator [Caulobacteraceae bacterium]|jgi:DNA-binding MarR family transcriptional regulator|nr:MarR family winged helix-turn-helix transcriptional regulator [Caulobacteraceae bacterium]